MDTFIEPIFKRWVNDYSRKIQVRAALWKNLSQTFSCTVLCQCNFLSEETSEDAAGHSDTDSFSDPRMCLKAPHIFWKTPTISFKKN